MLTKQDIATLKSVFSTKDDLTAMEKRMTDKIVQDVSDMLEDSVIKVLNEHEKRLDRLEKTVGGFPPLTD